MKIFDKIFAVFVASVAIGGIDSFAATCPADHYMLGANMAFNFGQPVDGKCPLGGGQHIREIPDDFVVIYNGAKFGTAVRVCPDGQYLDGDTCKSFTTGHCESGYNDMATIGASAFSALSPSGNSCYMGGYHKTTVPNDVYFIYNGFKSGTAATLCGPDAYKNGSECVALTQVGCPTGYKNIVAAGTALSPLNMNGACDTGKHTYSMNQSCDDENLSDATCLLVCPDGEQYTGVGTCASLCTAGATTLNLGTGLSIPMYSTKQIEPSLNIGLNGETCYVNLVPGSTSNSALMVQYGGSTYHTVE